MRCKKCGTVLAERKYEKCLCDDCQNRAVNLKFSIWDYMIKSLLVVVPFCILAIIISLNIVPWKTVISVIRLLIQFVVIPIMAMFCTFSLIKDSHDIYCGEKTVFQGVSKSFLVIFACVSFCVLSNLLIQLGGFHE